MADFTHPFWNWFIAIPTVLGMLWCFYLTFDNSRKIEPEDEGKTMQHVWDEDLQEINNPLPKWWLNLFYITIIFGFGYLILYPGLGSFQGLLDWSEVGQYEQELADAESRYAPLYEEYGSQRLAALGQNKNALGPAKRLYSTNCSICHGADAGGNTGFPNLRDDQWLYGGDGDTIKASITNGRNGIMPPWLGPLGEQGVSELTEYQYGFQHTPDNSEAALAGEQKFKTFCVGCHGANATGNTTIGAPNLTDKNWLYGGSKIAIRESISKGRKGSMPAHKDLLNDNKIHLLSAYILSLSKQP